MRPSERINEIQGQLIQQTIFDEDEYDRVADWARWRAIIEYLDEQYDLLPPKP